MTTKPLSVRITPADHARLAMMAEANQLPGAIRSQISVTARRLLVAALTLAEKGGLDGLEASAARAS